MSTEGRMVASVAVAQVKEWSSTWGSEPGWPKVGDHTDVAPGGPVEA
jgi:hypothetical protein